MKAGIYYELSTDEYRRAEGINKSGLDLVRIAPAVYASVYLHGHRQPSTKAFENGTAVHCAVLEPDRFLAEYLPAPKVDRRTSEGKEIFEDFKHQSQDKIVLPFDEYEQVCDQANAVLKTPLVCNDLFSTGNPETSLFWRDTKRKLNCKARADWFRDDGMIVDLKTTHSASPKDFEKSVMAFGYHRQAAWYLDGASEITGRIYNRFVFVCVQNHAPYLVSICELDPELIAYGREQNVEDLDRYASCLKSGQWPGFSDRIHKISMPGWLRAATASRGQIQNKTIKLGGVKNGV